MKQKCSIKPKAKGNIKKNTKNKKKQEQGETI